MTYPAKNNYFIVMDLWSTIKSEGIRTALPLPKTKTKIYDTLSIQSKLKVIFTLFLTRDSYLIW